MKSICRKVSDQAANFDRSIFTRKERKKQDSLTSWSMRNVPAPFVPFDRVQEKSNHILRAVDQFSREILVLIERFFSSFFFPGQSNHRTDWDRLGEISRGRTKGFSSFCSIKRTDNVPPPQPPALVAERARFARKILLIELPILIADRSPVIADVQQFHGRKQSPHPSD